MGGLDRTEHFAPPEFDPWTIQLGASFYTDYDIPVVDCKRNPHELRRQHYSLLGLPERLYFYESRVGPYVANP